jgi:hypothetical protein
MLNNPSRGILCDRKALPLHGKSPFLQVRLCRKLWNQAEMDNDTRALSQLVPDTFESQQPKNEVGISGKREKRLGKAERDPEMNRWWLMLTETQWL